VADEAKEGFLQGLLGLLPCPRVTARRK
jgi:hypothetical protein